MKTYIVTIQCRIDSDLSESDLEDKVASFLHHGTVLDSFDSADLNAYRLEVDSITEEKP